MFQQKKEAGGGEWESGKVGVGETGEEEEVGPRAQ